MKIETRGDVEAIQLLLLALLAALVLVSAYFTPTEGLVSTLSIPTEEARIVVPGESTVTELR